MTKHMTVRVELELLDAIERAAKEERPPVSNLRAAFSRRQAARDARSQQAEAVALPLDPAAVLYCSPRRRPGTEGR